MQTNNNNSKVNIADELLKVNVELVKLRTELEKKENQKHQRQIKKELKFEPFMDLYKVCWFDEFKSMNIKISHKKSSPNLIRTYNYIFKKENDANVTDISTIRFDEYTEERINKASKKSNLIDRIEALYKGNLKYDSLSDETISLGFIIENECVNKNMLFPRDNECQEMSIQIDYRFLMTGLFNCCNYKQEKRYVYFKFPTTENKGLKWFYDDGGNLFVYASFEDYDFKAEINIKLF